MSRINMDEYANSVNHLLSSCTQSNQASPSRPKIRVVDDRLWLLHRDSAYPLRLRESNGEVEVGCTDVTLEAMRMIAKWVAEHEEKAKEGAR